MAIYLVRHAHAGSRSAWSGDDLRRPLDKKGRRQAQVVADLLAGETVDQVLSSAATRCVETLEPLGAKLGVPVETHPVLAEGTDPDDALAMVCSLPPVNAVLCSHGDVIPGVLRRLRQQGMRTIDHHLCAKGSIWVLEVEDDRIVSGRYLPPGS